VGKEKKQKPDKKCQEYNEQLLISCERVDIMSSKASERQLE
jgi:hypothetical protein